MHQQLAEFVQFCRVERRLAELTCSAYERDVSACIAFLEREGITSLEAARVPDLRRFLSDEAVRRPAASSQARTVAALKCFFRFLVESEYIDRDPEEYGFRLDGVRSSPVGRSGSHVARVGQDLNGPPVTLVFRDMRHAGRSGLAAGGYDRSRWLGVPRANRSG